MIIVNAKILFEAFLKRFCIFWSQDANGECSHMTILSGSWYTIISENGFKMEESSIYLTNL